MLRWLCILLTSYTTVASQLRFWGTNHTQHQLHFPSPAFDLGNTTFGVLRGGEVVVIKGCGGFGDFPQALFRGKLVIAHQGPGLDFCSSEHYIFECQRLDCIGVILQDFKRDVAGLGVWSIFEKLRPSSDFKVPLVAVNTHDYNQIMELVQAPNATFEFAITADSNPWREMFMSVAFLLIFRVFFCSWCTICAIISFSYVVRIYARSNSVIVPTRTRTLTSGSTGTTTSQGQQRVRRASSTPALTRNTLAFVCLILECIGNLERAVYLAVDPFYGHQILPYLPATVMLSISLPIKLATNILLLFFWREVASTTRQLTFVRRFRVPCYVLIAVVVVADLVQSILDGLFLGTALWSMWVVKSAVFVVVNIALGTWLLYEGFKLLRLMQRGDASKRTTTATQRQKSLARLVVTSAFGMFSLGVFLALVSVHQVFGKPWGYFATWFLIVLSIQVTSHTQIGVFSGAGSEVSSGISGDSINERRSWWSVLESWWYGFAVDVLLCRCGFWSCPKPARRSRVLKLQTQDATNMK